MARIDERLLNIDRHGAVAVPAVLWVAMAFLARYWIVVGVVFASAKRSPNTVQLLGQDFAWYMLLLEVPAIVLMVAAANRRPDAGRMLRAVWAQGRRILMATAALHLASAALALAASSAWRRWPELFIASCALLDLAIFYAMAKDEFFARLFADYPQRPGTA